MGKCLITKLNGSVQNDSLLRIGEFIIKVSTVESPTADSQKISVRNDIELRQKTKSDKRKEGLSFLTSYTYFSSLLQQAGLVFKQNGYFVLKEEYRSDIEKLLEV